MNNQIDIIEEILIDFDEMGFVPSTTVPDPDGYAVEWKRKLVNALAGYRKQSEGKWIPSPDGIKPIRCNKCHMPAPFMSCDDDFGVFGIYRYPWKFCPNCGAKMKGGE